METPPVQSENPAPRSAVRWRIAPLVLIVAGTAIAWVSALTAAYWSFWQLGVLLGGGIGLGAIFWLRRRAGEQELELVEREQDLARNREQFEQRQQEAEAALKSLEKQIIRRERGLTQRLHTYHEWMEFPQPIDIEAEPTGDARLSEADLADLAERDRQLHQLLDAESQRLYEAIRKNAYHVEGKFQPLLLRDELYELARKVARVYQPDVEHPLLETSMENVLRAVSRVSVQLLVVLDGLPLNVKRYNLQNMYGYIRQAVVAFGLYKSASPYLPYVNAAWLTGRVVLGANPLTLGAWWLAREIGMRGAKRVAGKLADQQALALLQTVVRVVGYEVAAMYAGDFRHRDANWVYGAELVELITKFPPSRESLSQGLREIGAIQLRGEYDRIFLYRCLAAHRSVNPSRYRAAVTLTAEERRAVAQRLEKFFAAYIHGRTADRVTAWRAAVEQRLDVRLELGDYHLNPDAGAARRRELEEGLRSLASFLVAAREREPEEIPHVLAACRLAKALPAEAATTQIAALAADPPYFFEQAELEPGGATAGEYVEDLIDLALLPPADAEAESLVLDAAMYLRHQPEKVRQKFDEQYIARLSAKLPDSAPTRRLPAWAARSVLAWLPEEEKPLFVYSRLQWDEPFPVADQLPTAEVCLVGTSNWLVLLAAREHEEPEVLWRADGSAAAVRRGSLVASDCRVTGGQWLNGQAPAKGFRLTGPRVGSSQTFFQPLLSRLNGASE